jgi:hypothetical protein
LLFNVLDILIDLRPILNGAPYGSDVIKSCKMLLFSARRIQTRRYCGLAEKLIEFALKDVKHTREESDELIDDIAKEISKPYYGYYRKEKEFFKKVAKGMRERLESENTGRKI